MADEVKTTPAIIAELQSGHDIEDNFRVLFQRYYSQLVRFFQRKGLDGEDSRDLTQKVFISVYTGLRDFRGDSKFETWLFRIALNAYMTEVEHRQAKKRDVVQVPLEQDYANAADTGIAPLQVADPGLDPAQTVLEKEKLESLRQAIAELPEQMRRCAQLRLVKELSYQEIASVMGISINTVKAHLHHSQKVLREKLRAHFGELEL